MSLAIVGLASLFGAFLQARHGFSATFGYLAAGDMIVGAGFLGGAVVGMAVGIRLKAYFPAATLKKIFGYTVIPRRLCPSSSPCSSHNSPSAAAFPSKRDLKSRRKIP
jgi:uncharacterized membrane protein YfcA